MTQWHWTRRGDLGLRAFSLGVLAVSCASVSHLMRLHAADPVHWRPGLVAYVLTTIGFLSGSAGAALTLLGAHLFDEVQVSERWRVKPPIDCEMRVDAAADIKSVAEVAPASEAVAFAALRAERNPSRVGRDPVRHSF